MENEEKNEENYNEEQNSQSGEKTYNEPDDSKISKQEILDIKKMDRASQVRKSTLISGAVSIVLGAILLFWPGLTMEIICQFVGAALGITGVLTAAVYFTQPKETPFRALSLVAGIPLAVVGLLIFLNPEFLIDIIPIIVGGIILIDGVVNLLESMSLMRQGYSKWWISLIVSIITLILGFILITRPFGAAKFIMRLIGGVTLYNGISDLYIASRIKTKIKDVD